MEEIYENTDCLHSSINSKGSPRVHQEKDVTPSKGTTVLLIVLCVCVVLAVGGLCVLGVLYYNKLADFESWNVQYNMVLMQLSAQDINNKKERKSYKFKMSREFCFRVNCPFNNTIMEKMYEELTDNFTTVKDQLSSYKVMERDLHELKAKYNSLRSSFLNAQSCNLSTDGWTVCRRMFYFSADKQNWSKSRDVCVSMGADLVTITSKEEQEFLVSKIKVSHWIGLNDLEIEGRWVWVNNQTLEETGVQFWFRSGQKEPDNWRVEDPSGENCASLGDSNGNLQAWFDGSCKKQKKFICEKKY